MEYCAYEDAFPNLTAEAEGNGEKKGKQRTTDPDRLTPRMKTVEALVAPPREEEPPPPAQPPAAPAPKKKKKRAQYLTVAAGEEGWKEAPFTDVIGNDSTYRLYPDFQSAFKRVVSEAGAAGVPSAPSIADEWKPLTPNTQARTAFFDDLPAPGGGIVSTTESSVLAKKIDLLFSRLDDLESRRGENTQTEILLFVMSGLFVLFSMDILTRHA